MTRATSPACAAPPTSGGGWVDPDTLITPRSFDVATHVVGGTLEALDAVLAGDVGAAFCLVRPPGHHATPVQAMGFCLFNHVAIAAAYARHIRGLDRVAIVDFDVHHGNGTQDAFYADPSRALHLHAPVPVLSRQRCRRRNRRRCRPRLQHQYPATGQLRRRRLRRRLRRDRRARARTLPAGLLLVSAGFDAHFADELADERLSVDGYGGLVARLIEAANRLCDGRLLLALEGGYDLVALPWCVRRTLELLLGDAPTPESPRPRAGRAIGAGHHRPDRGGPGNPRVVVRTAD